MAHWQHRPEGSWSQFEFNQPYAKGLARLRDEVLAKTDFDPATLWQWGTMQAMAIIEVLKACEAAFGRDGQQVVADALRRVGLDIGRQILAGKTKPDDMSEAEFVSYYATVINRIVYASLEAPQIDSDQQVSFDILWCPHQDHYQAFDCRVQRYFVQGMLEALEEFGVGHGFQVRFDSTIPAGADCCHFTLWKTDAAGQEAWQNYTAVLDEKALRHAARAAADAAARAKS
ncbi:MAG: L-2-amino-thiazoline-4-carboxylic acid hydrolase [Pirellulales bacterium]|nr:L-2-amino-thiazoline-4-carboxylic acid hydrolase [Pirellulales bacterium]